MGDRCFLKAIRWLEVTFAEAKHLAPVDFEIVREQHVQDRIGDGVRVGESRDDRVDELYVGYVYISVKHDHLKNA